jgi:hypothetical protein
MSQVTELASGQITAIDTLTIELVQADEMPTVVIIRWPAKPSLLHPHRFGAVAEIAAWTFAAAVAKLTAIKRERRLPPSPAACGAYALHTAMSASIFAVRPPLPGLTGHRWPRCGGSVLPARRRARIAYVHPLLDAILQMLH